MALKPLTNRSRGNLPNPSFSKNNQYVPTNSPALADLFDAFGMNRSPRNYFRYRRGFANSIRSC
jgi:hypothetical protein